MSLNFIEFSKENIADLFKHSLIELNGNDLPVQTFNDRPQWKYLGENRKNVLIIVSYPDAAYLPDKQLEFLTNLLTACKLNLGDTALLNMKHCPSKDFNSITSYFKPNIVFLFGVDPAGFGMPLLFPHFQVQLYNEATYLFAPALQEIEAEKTLKIKLWVCLKKIFNL